MKTSRSLAHISGGSFALIFAGLFLASPPLPLEASNTRWSLSVGIGVPAGGREFYHGRDRYYAYRGSYYRWDRGRYYPCPPPRGYYVRDLPPHYERVYVGPDVYYRVNHIYYRQSGGYYEVIDAPVIIERPVDRKPSKSVNVPKADELVAVWLQGERYLLDNGEFFKNSSQGRVWVETPIGALIKEMPIGALTVWHEETEYFEFDGAYFRRSPEGFKVVTKPWTKPKADPNGEIGK